MKLNHYSIEDTGLADYKERARENYTFVSKHGISRLCFVRLENVKYQGENNSYAFLFDLSNLQVINLSSMTKLVEYFFS